MKGIAASPGIAIGNAHVIHKIVLDTEKRTINDTNVELQRLDSCIEKSLHQLQKIYQETCEKISKDEAQVFEAHKLMLMDAALIGDIRNIISKDSCCSEYAVNSVFDRTITIFENIDDEYMRERAQDLEDVKSRLLSVLLDVELAPKMLGKNLVLFAEDLTPSDTVSIDKSQVLAFVTEKGGTNSHTAIMARMLGIPAIVGVSTGFSHIASGDQVIVDGNNGFVHVDPSEDQRIEFREIKAKEETEREKLFDLVDRPALTSDGRRVHLCGNIASVGDLDNVINVGSDGVGLFRTEFLFMDRKSAPSEEEQFTIYRDVAQKLDGLPLTIRTLDIGGDKNVDYLGIGEEENPFLGCRAIRLCFVEEDIFKTQLRAILRASAYGCIKMMFPMISGVEEFRKAKDYLQQTMKDLDRDHIKYDRSIRIGIMIEIPSAAIMSDVLAREVDFFSIGTNDLIQYCIAVDRMNTSVESLYTPYEPAVLRLIKLVIDNAHDQGIEVGMCGEAASDPLLIPLLIGFGLDEFSMSASVMLKSKQIIQSLSFNKLAKTSTLVLDCCNSIEVKNTLNLL